MHLKARYAMGGSYVGTLRTREEEKGSSYHKSDRRRLLKTKPTGLAGFWARFWPFAPQKTA